MGEEATIPARRMSVPVPAAMGSAQDAASLSVNEAIRAAIFVAYGR